MVRLSCRATCKRPHSRRSVFLAGLAACLLAAAGPAPQAHADETDGMLPGGSVAKASRGDIRSAWYTRPTSRYPHGVLGDAIEGGALSVITNDGMRLELVLAESHVFEDLTPRIVDLDGDGRNEVVTIRSSLVRGAAVAVYGLAGDKLVQRGVTPEIGKANRWLSIAGIADYLTDGVLHIAFVETPHIGGTLKFARFSGGRLSVAAKTFPGVSNHVIGSSRLSMSASADIDGDGVTDLAVPSADRRSLVIHSGGHIVVRPASGQISGAIRFVGGRFVTTGADGGRIEIEP
nr:hypothetical protein [Mesorhizobium sp.]